MCTDKTFNPIKLFSNRSQALYNNEKYWFDLINFLEVGQYR